ncbi:hypothetical protein RWA02_31895 (plasmid) [Sinorhizobium meliloti]|uniref:ABC transporter permease n=1 Tax=Rhizobium meliloti TaxID=382 RepID=UPI000FDC4FD6|nr:hypothetical protein [Sinorhizobium meliloti]MDW9626907.1 hypothetical protein [Sinorhizobium meliloti]MDW9997609.1 hypothetical protein [Sinorhizobium meliloti]RVK72129.1 hypothetical protein CN157_23060 [Sinorhizobium meliloti]RVQ64710.1 hypothetical protein CN061_34530 [Sinorhizobium meliloti]
MAAIGLQRYTGAAESFVSSLLMSPLFIPAAIVALALFQIIFMMGGGNNIWILVAAHIGVTLPYPVRNVMAQIGATPSQALPARNSAFAEGEHRSIADIVFVLSWNNYTISVFLANKDWTTLPLQLRAYLQYEYEPFVAAMSTILIIASIILLGHRGPYGRSWDCQEARFLTASIIQRHIVAKHICVSSRAATSWRIPCGA